MTNFNNEFTKAALLFGTYLFLACCGLLMMCSCTTTKYVPVEGAEIHTKYIDRADTVVMIDSVVDYQREVLREVDSAYMSQLGIQMQSAQRAWLLERTRLKQEVAKAKELGNNTIIIHDSIDRPVMVKDKAELSTFDKIKMRCFTPLIVIAIVLFMLTNIFANVLRRKYDD